MLLKLLEQRPRNGLGRSCSDFGTLRTLRAGVPARKELSKIYQHWLTGSMKKSAIQKADQHNTSLHMSALLKARTLREFDNLGTAPPHGFRDADHYYTIDSCRQHLSRITTPTLIIQAKDDPFITLDLLPEEHELGPGIQLEFSDKGGHTGFVEGYFPGLSRYWLENRLLIFLTQANSTRTVRRSENA